MKTRNTVFVLALSIAAVPALADDAAPTPPTTPQGVESARDTLQQERIEQGLQTGALNTNEAGRLERQETHVDQMESHAAANGNVSPEEAARINAAQNRVSRRIYAQKHDAQAGNPVSASSQRMQANVQRDANQEARINQGVQSGQLTTREAGRLERGEARNDRTLANAAANGHVSAPEAAHTEGVENRQSRRVYVQKHDEQTN